MIEVILYSYRNKNLRTVVDSLIENTKDELLIHVRDQNTIDRSEKFKDVDYKHIFWDRINSPCELKGSLVHQANASHILIISDDALVSKNWDVAVKDFIDNRNIMVSGAGKVTLSNPDIFSIVPIVSNSDNFSLSQYAVREFMFAAKNVWNEFHYPANLKYNGEQEIVSLNAFRSSIDIYSGPSSIYTDLMVRSLDNLYVPFSKDHNYNDAVEQLTVHDRDQYFLYSRWREEFLKFHNLTDDSIVKLPYQNNDVSYLPENMAFQDIDARKFISNTKAIY